MNRHMMSAIGELQKHRDEIQRLIRDLERVMAGMSHDEALVVVAKDTPPMAAPNPRVGPRRNPNPKLRTGRPTSAGTDTAGLAIIQALGQALTPLTPTEVMIATHLERWKVAKLLMDMTAKGAIEKTGYASYQLPHRAPSAPRASVSTSELDVQVS